MQEFKLDEEVIEKELDEESETVDFSKVEEENAEEVNNIFNEVEINHSTDNVRNYLKEIGSIPLLTVEEEYNYAKDVSEGIKADLELKEIEANDQNEVSLEKYNELLEISDKGRFAREKLANGNLRLVVAISKHYMNRGLEFLDLIQEGNMGLLKAIDKFNPDMGFKFSTYATWWIRQSITRGIADQSRTIRIPVHMVETINHIKRTERELTSLYGRTPTDEELADRVGLDVDKLNRIRSVAQSPVSLESPVGEEEDSTLGDFISDDNQMDPYQYTKQKKMKGDIDKVLNELLSDRERDVIVKRFGLDGLGSRTLEEVAKSFVPQVTRERIRQIECKALRKLMRSPKAKALRDYVA